ncbi:MAG TPA: lipocalin-like domain-containing protein [Usitatibacter sp.]|nr:lipocalin-like domain-containing protein [Usitatibacter sp.]
MSRCCAALLLFLWAFAAMAEYDPVVPGVALEFPRDRGAHLGHRIEWWYVTGHLDSKRGPLGFQVTFFRVRNPGAEASASRFAPKQVVFAHAALADPASGRLLHDQRSARELPPLVEARREETHVRIDDWSLARDADIYRTRIAGADFTLELAMAPTQPVMLQGERGFSRKGALGTQASYYYSETQLRVSGRISARGAIEDVSGVAWLDHEWSSEVLAGDASGWDWLGANLDDGGALMAFRIRSRDGATLWSTATLRSLGGPITTLDSAQVSFTPKRLWKSPRTGTSYPVAMEVRIGARTWRVEPLLDDQELDARTSTGTLYWEGAVRMQADDGTRARAYLELTGYAERVPF